MLSVLYQNGGRTLSAEGVDPAWLAPGSDVIVWVDLVDPTPEEGRILVDTFHFHELAVEDALSTMHHPKIDSYGDYMYLILHGIDFRARGHRFATHDADFFVGSNYLVTLHDSKMRSIPAVRELCLKGDHILREGPLALTHRVLDAMVEHYRPEVEKLQERIDRVERKVFRRRDRDLIQTILRLKRDVASLRRVVIPQRDLIARLARREFPMVTEALAYRFRDVYDQLVRLTDEAAYFHDRITGLLDAHLANVSNRLNEVMKVLTLIATIFMPLTVLTSLYGMNVQLPHLPGGPEAQFWWIIAMMGATTGTMLWYFRTRKWL